MPALQSLTILGSTGSVGANTLDVVERHPGRFSVIALTANAQSDVLLAQCLRHRPRYAVISAPQAAEALAKRMKEAGLDTEVLCGPGALERVATLPEVDTVMAAIVGIAGLKPTFAAAMSGKKVLLANKEALVTAGPVLMRAARVGGATLLPIDSEHNAIFQALPREYARGLDACGVRRILLTASGGPFRLTSPADLAHVTPDAACAHPNWVMGRKISVDSATMMNKGLEVIEARWLFDATPDQIEVVIHPESVVHSLVEYVDGSVIAQLGNPDMRTPIAHALGFPERMDAGVDFLDLARIGVLHFQPPDTGRFPCLRLAYEALRTGGSAPAVLNAANEVAVERFLAGTIGFTEIAGLIEAVLGRCVRGPLENLDDVLAADRAARECAEECLARPGTPRRSAALAMTGSSSAARITRGTPMNILYTTAAFLVTLGCLIVIHELGHYWIARLCNVKVLRFSVGFGKPLWSRERGPDRTEWVIAAFPLGGYVKMLDEREGPVDPSEVDRAFNRQSVGRRFLIVLAGPVANFLLAIALYWVLFMHGVPGLKPVIGPVPEKTPAAVAGFSAGDTITKIGDDPVQTWQDARWVLLQHAVRKSPVKVTTRGESGAVAERDLDLSHITAADLDSDFLRALGLTRYYPPLPPVIGNVIRGGAAERAGLKAGDEIVAIDNRSTSTWQDVVMIVRANPGREITLEVLREGGRTSTVAVTPEAVAEAGKPVGRIGAGSKAPPAVPEHLSTEVRYGPVEALGKAFYKTWDTSAFSLQMLGKMIVGEVSLKNLSGPITIADYAGQSAQMGWIAYLLFLALISISLGVLNLLPIPLLDGGHLMYYIFEVFKGSPVSDKAIEIGQHLGMALLFVLMAFALYNDINRLISG